MISWFPGVPGGVPGGVPAEVQMGATVPLKLPQLVALAQTEFPPDYVRGWVGIPDLMGFNDD